MSVKPNQKHNKLAIIILVIVGLIAWGTAFGGSMNSTPQSKSKSAETSKTESTPQTYKIGQAVRDGKFEFTVNKLSCGETSVGGEYLKTTAQGQFCRVNITVKNIGNEAQTLSHSDQYAYNAQKQKYSADTTAAIYSNSNSSGSTWYNEINPGNTVSGDLFFDMPAGVNPVEVELHDSGFSGGVRVNL